MISAGEVGAVFVIKDEASVVLRAIEAQMRALQGTIDKTAASFKTMKLPPGVATAIGRIDKAMATAMGTAGKLETSMADIGVAADRGAVGAVAGFGRIDTAISTTQGKLAALRKEMGSVGRGMGGGGGNSGVPGVGGRGRSGGAGHSPLHTNAHFGPAGMRTSDTQLVGGAVAAFGLWESIKAGADLEKVQFNMRGGGVSNDEVQKATRESFRIGRLYGLNATDVLQGINETRNIFNEGKTPDGGVEAALHRQETLAAAAVVLKNKGGKGGVDVAADIYDMVKSTEFRNAIKPEDFDKAIGSMIKADVATGGIVNPRTFLQMSQMLKGALPGLSDHYLYEVMPELAQEFKGQGAGTAAASLYQQLIAGQMRTKGINLLAGLGMVNDDKVEWAKDGRIKSANPGFFTDADTFRADPGKSIANIIDAMEKHGITSESAQRDMFASLFGNRNAAQMAQTLGYQWQRLNRGATGIENTEDPSIMARQLLQGNPYTQWDQFTASATNAGASIGTLAMPAAIKALNGLTTVANAVGQYMRGDAAGIDKNAVNSVLFGDKTSLLRKLANWAEGVTPTNSGPHGIAGPGLNPSGAGGRQQWFGRDPRSSSTDPTLAYHPPNAPVTVSATLSGPATVKTGPITLSVSGQSIVAALAGEIGAKIEGLFRSLGPSGTNGDSGHDGRSSPAYPDHMHGSH